MPTTAATTVRKGKEPIIMDGPFAETKEQLLGFYIVECANLEQAIETAKDLFHFHGLCGALLRDVGRAAEARTAFTRAIALARSPTEAAHIRAILDRL